MPHAPPRPLSLSVHRARLRAPARASARASARALCAAPLATTTPCAPHRAHHPVPSQAAARFTEALYRGEAAGLIQEMRLNPTGPGVEPFLVALQASTDAAKKEEEKKDEDKMDES